MLNVVQKNNFNNEGNFNFEDNRKKYINRTVDIRSTVRDFVSSEGKNVVSTEIIEAKNKNNSFYKFY